MIVKDFVLLCTYVVMCLLITLYAFANQGTGYWSGWSGCDYDPGPWCEEERTNDFLREPMNSLSDFVFLAVAFLMLRCALVDFSVSSRVRRARNMLVALPVVSLMGALANLVHFFGTFLNHASRCHVFHRLDAFAMFWVLTFWTLYWIVHNALWTNGSLEQLLDSRSTRLRTVVSVVFVVFMLLVAVPLWEFASLYYRDPSNELREIGCVGLNVALVLFMTTYYVFNSENTHFEFSIFMVAFILFMIGVAFHRMDVQKVFCSPTSYVQGHAIWHAVTGLALYCCYIYARRIQE